LEINLKVTTTLVERTLGLGSTGDTKLQYTIFILIESAMALFAVQVVRLVFSFNFGPGVSSLNDNIRYRSNVECDYKICFLLFY
jgi:hypothetical protein